MKLATIGKFLTRIFKKKEVKESEKVLILNPDSGRLQMGEPPTARLHIKTTGWIGSSGPPTAKLHIFSVRDITHCRNCNFPHHLKDEDKGSERDEMKFCIECYNKSKQP
jgi:hypothetical protein